MCISFAVLLTVASASALAAEPSFEIKPVSDELAKEYTLDKAFYKKCTLVQNILIATSDKVSDYTHREAAYLFDAMMRDVNPAIAQRVRDRKVLCIIAAHNEQVSDVPQFRSDKTGKELDFYNWRNRGFLNMDTNGHPTVFFAEEDVMEYEGGMQLESILIHEFGHVVAGAGFDAELRKRLNEAYINARNKKLWNDGYAAQKFRRVKSDTPVSLFDALVKAFPAQSPELIKACLDGGDILVNGKPADAKVQVTKNDKVLIVFGGPKNCYHSVNSAEYWAEGFQTWYDTNRTMDHDHNHIHTREQIKEYDPVFAKLLEDVLGDSKWRFVSPRSRAGKDHLAGYDPAKAPKVIELEHIAEAGLDYYDGYWSGYWKRLREKHGLTAASASADYREWKHSGSIHILTTPDGANLPASAAVEQFPLLVRLHKDSFNFSQAKANGDDIRFSTPAGMPLAYQIEEWDAAKGIASIWVRIPAIKGNERQEIKVHWGNADATSESSGKAVFNETNGYLSVFHMNGPVIDETGKLETKDTGTTAAPGMIGQARSFPGKKGIFCGDKIAGFPTGAGPNTTEAWIRSEVANGRVVGWGNEAAQGKVVMQYRSPPHIRMDCYFSNADVSSKSAGQRGEWMHVVHTYRNGESLIYVNGVLDGVTKTASSPLNIKSPARMWIGGWYDNYDFVGEIDEVRISSVTRSADWVKLQYENQKPLQTLTGHLVQPGDALTVSPSRISIAEGKIAAITAKAGGAQKVYWVLKRDGKETIVATDRFSHTFDAGRVTGDQAATLQLKAVYPNEVKSLDIPIEIKEEIPDPVFTLTAPATWDGRATIEVAPQVTNLSAMQAKGAGDLKTQWSVSPFAVIQEIVPGKLILKRAQNSGTLTVTATLSNGGKLISQSATITVTEPKRDAWVVRTPGKDEKPQDGQFYARDDNNEGTLHYNGTLAEAADTVFLRLYADEKLVTTESAKPGADLTYGLAVKLKPGLIKYKVEFGTKAGGRETVRQTVNNIVCGDAYIITGQSNALATDTREKSPPETHDWIRSYGRPPGNSKPSQDNLWCNPVWKAEKGEPAELGWWGMELAKRLVQSQKVPIFIINAAVGGTRIDQHQRSTTDPADLATIYGRMLWRVQQAKLTHGIRGILWHQGENDQGSDGPTGGYGWETYQQLFIEMSAAWKQDFPNVGHYYIFQIWPDSCSMGGRNGSGDMLREKQRTLPRLYSNMSIMSTLGVRPAGGCHFPLEGWGEFARLIQPLIERDFYGKAPAASITPPNLRSASFTQGAKDTIVLEFDQPVVWTEKLAGQFYLDGEKGKIASGSVAGNVLTLKLKEPSAATKITYLKEIAWNQDTLLNGENGIAALTFCNVPLAPTVAVEPSAAR